MNMFWIATVGFLFGTWCGVLLVNRKLQDANDELIVAYFSATLSVVLLSKRS